MEPAGDWEPIFRAPPQVPPEDGNYWISEVDFSEEPLVRRTTPVEVGHMNPSSRVLEIRSESSLDILEAQFDGYMGFKRICMDIGEYPLVVFATECQAMSAMYDAKLSHNLRIIFADTNRLRQVEDNERAHIKLDMTNDICNTLQMSHDASFEEYAKYLRSIGKNWTNGQDAVMKDAFIQIQNERQSRLPMLENEVRQFLLHPVPGIPLEWAEFVSRVRNRENPLHWYNDEDIFLRGVFEELKTRHGL